MLRRILQRSDVKSSPENAHRSDSRGGHGGAEQDPGNVAGLRQGQRSEAA